MSFTRDLAISLEEVFLRRGGRTVLKGVSAGFKRGTVTAIVGPSAAGKTSLLRCCNRLDEPSEGRVLFHSADVRSIDPRTLRKAVGMIFQNPVLFAGDVRSNLGYGLEDADEGLLADVLRRCGLPESLLERDARAISVGEARRVCIARALVRGPQVLLLDEPTSALDHKTTSRIESLVGSLKRLRTHNRDRHRRSGPSKACGDSRRVNGWWSHRCQGKPRASHASLARGACLMNQAAIIQVAASLVFALTAFGISHIQRLGLESELVITAARAIAQLLAVAVVIQVVFASTGLSGLFLLLMLGAASITAGLRLRGVRGAQGIALVSIAGPAGLAIAVLFGSQAFDFEPRFLIPIAGILIGNTMIAVSLAGRRMRDEIRDDVRGVEARLALGASARDALSTLASRSTRNALIPTIDQTKNVGIVTLPGAFVGMMLGGATPLEAAIVQIVILFTLLGVVSLAAILASTLVARSFVGRGDRIVLAAAPSRST
jgi:putative ABC transport system permease protein